MLMKKLPFDFDSDEYLAVNVDVKNAGIDPIEHYLQHGMQEGRSYKTGMPVLGLALIIKDEAPYILEWIAYHMVLGVDRFIIVDNNSSDGTKEILFKLQNEGLINLIHFNGYKDKAPQLLAYTEVLKNTTGIDWLGFIDTDEFISINSDLSLKKLLLDIFKNEKIGAIALNWAIFGSSLLLEKENGLVTERFKYRAFQKFNSNHHFKSILQINSVSSVGGTPHKFQLKNDKKYVHSDGSVLIDNQTHGEGLSDKVILTPIKLNHYMLKSKFEFDLRAKKPNVAHLQYNIKDDKYFSYHDRNEIFDPINDELISAVKFKVNVLEGVVNRDIGLINSNLNLTAQSGRIDHINYENNLIRVSGWCCLFIGLGKEIFSAILNKQELEIVSVRPIKRNDIFEELNTTSPFCGFELVCHSNTIDFSTLIDVNEFEIVVVHGSQVEILKITNFKFG